MLQTFEEFLAGWRARRALLPPKAEQEGVFLQWARELTEEALQKGFRRQLMEAMSPYRSTEEFVRARADEQRFRTDRSNGEPH